MKYLYACLISLASAAALNAQIVMFDLVGQAGPGLLSGNETGTINGSPGSGGEIGSGIWFDQATNILTVNVGWGSVNSFTDLSGTATGAHIHGPANQTSTAVVILNFASTAGYSFSTGASNGSVTGSANVAHLVTADLLAGNWYINIHTATNGGGEIRGNLVQVSPVPEPSSYTFLAGFGALGFVATRRRRT